MRAAAGLCWMSVLVAFVTGCKTSSGTLHLPGVRVPASVAEREPANAGTEKANDTSSAAANNAPQVSPFVAEREKAKKESANSSSSETAPQALAQSTSASERAANQTSQGAKPLAFQPEILKLIDEELKDATPEERAQWYEQLKKVEPAVIPEILRARRMSLQLAQQQEAPKPPASPEPIPLRRSLHDYPSPSPTSISRTEIGSQSVQQAGFTGGVSSEEVLPTGHQVAAGSRQPDPRGGPSPSSSFPPAIPEQQTLPATGAPLVVQKQPLPSGNDPRGPHFSEPGAAPVPWPPSKPVASTSNNNRQNLAQPLAFGAGLMQNVVGLVPNRGSTPSVQPNVAATPPSLPAEDLDWHKQLSQTISLLEQELARQRSTEEVDLQDQVALRLLYLIANQQERALTAIPGLDAAEQEFWQQVMWGLTNALDTQHLARPEDRAAQTIAQLQQAIRRLQEKADLQIRNVAFSRQNLGYGNYDRLPRNEFRPGHEVLLYAEIENFKSEPTAEGQYRTLLRSTIEILSPAGELRKKIDFPATEDLCRNYRRDYFHNYQFTIPDRLPLGPHVLKLTVFDELSGKMASYTINFLVN